MVEGNYTKPTIATVVVAVVMAVVIEEAMAVAVTTTVCPKKVLIQAP